jgi:inhibitor of cysteine peptidase
MSDPVKIRLKEQGVVSLPVGEEVQIEVDENPTTGYRWELQAEPANGVDLLNTSFCRRGAGVGAGGSRVWTVRLTRPANVLLHAFLRRPWQPTSAPQESASVELVAL